MAILGDTIWNKLLKILWRNFFIGSYYSTGAIIGNTWQYFAIPGDTCQYLTILLQHFPILSILTNTKQYLPIPNNTKQYLMNLVSFGIAWYRQSIKYHNQYDSSFVKVSLQYNFDSFCLSGIVYVLILAISTKPPMLTRPLIAKGCQKNNPFNRSWNVFNPGNGNFQRTRFIRSGKYNVHHFTVVIN